MLTINEFIANALKVPFKEKGRDLSGWDCYGLVFCAYRDVLGIDLPSYDDDYIDTGNSPESRKALNDLILCHTHEWDEVKDGTKNCRPMDIVLFTLGVNRLHVGIVVDKRRFLHCERKVGTVIERTDGLIWTKRVEGIYRIKEGDDV